MRGMHVCDNSLSLQSRLGIHGIHVHLCVLDEGGYDKNIILIRLRVDSFQLDPIRLIWGFLCQFWNDIVFFRKFIS